MESIVIHGYIPDRFKRTFRGHKLFGFDDDFKEFLRKEKRKEQLSRRCLYIHTSRGGQHLQQDIKDIIEDCIDWDYVGNDEYPIKTINKSLLAKKILQYLKQRKVLKHLI